MLEMGYEASAIYYPWPGRDNVGSNAAPWIQGLTVCCGELIGSHSVSPNENQGRAELYLQP